MKRGKPPNKISAKKLAALGGKMPFSSVTAPRKAIKPKTRSASEFARIYGSNARVEWVKSLPCAGCGCIGRSENAHTVTGGTRRKADFSTIAPLCGSVSGGGVNLLGCHKLYDRHLAPFDTDRRRAHIKRAAAMLDQDWRWLMLSATNPMAVD